MACHTVSFKFFLKTLLVSLSCHDASPAARLGIRESVMSDWLVQLTQTVLTIAGLLAAFAVAGLIQLG